MSNSVFSFLRHAALAVGISLSASAFAAPVTYEFTTVDGHYGSFSYEDSLVSTSPPGNTAAGYSLLSFTLDGASLPNPYVVIDKGNSFHFGDLAHVTSVDSNGLLAALWLNSNGSAFTGNNLAQLNGRTLADYTVPGFDRTRLNIGLATSKLASLQQVASIPEPGTSALMVMGLATLVAARRTAARAKA
ncbi:MAG: PEP-CTERM sorting domain-containing protein [Rubrivivax sp.]|nr:MAG: PEP-CTERM sorting domain-containing protein [Rubrivivax sp.]